jgi:hypothetical protein
MELFGDTSEETRDTIINAVFVTILIILAVFEYIFCLILKYLLEFFFWLVFTNVFNYLNSNHDYSIAKEEKKLFFMVVRQSAARQSANTITVNRQSVHGKCYLNCRTEFAEKKHILTEMENLYMENVI